MIITVRDHTFFTHRLGPGSVVVDLGANHGDFTKEMVIRFGAKCVAVEANGVLASELAQQLGDVSVKHAAVAAREGPVELQLTANHETSSIVGVSPWEQSVSTESIEGITLSSLVIAEKLETIELVKVDIEGAEVAMFESTPREVLDRVAQFSVEFHDFRNVVSEQDVNRMIERLEASGFSSIRFSRDNTNWLFVHRKRSGVGLFEFTLTKFVLRNVRGGLRIVRRWLVARQGPARSVAAS